MKAIETGGSLNFVKGAMLAVARVGGEENAVQFEFVLKYFLTEGGAEINNAALAALGALGNDALYPLVKSIALDEESGRAACKKPEVPTNLRAFAAYGLGMIGESSRDVALRGAIVKDLVTMLEHEDTAPDLRAAAMTAMGLVPLPVVEGHAACYCGTCKVEGPETSLQAQVTYLMRYFTAKKEFGPATRAQTATTLARLIEAQPVGMPPELKEGVADLLIGSLERSARQPTMIKESSVLGLGLIGDADDEAVDKWIRWALNRSAGSGSPLERRFALMSLAMVGSRGGSGDEAFAGTPGVRSDLLHHLSRGRKTVKPWAGLALGVMGYHLSDNGQARDPKVDLALRNVLKRVRSVEDFGAYALASGLRRDKESSDLLLSKIAKLKDEGARAYAALGLGLMGSQEAIEPLQEIVARSEETPVLVARAGLALGLLGDHTVVPRLLDTMITADPVAERALTQALGYLGDERSIEKLIELTLDKKVKKGVREAAVVALGFLGDTSAESWRSALARGANYRAEAETWTSPKGTGILDLE